MSSEKTLGGIVPLPIKDVSSTCISMLRSIPLVRANEGFVVPGSVNSISDKVIPQQQETVFKKLYVTDKLISNNKLDVTSTELFPNYYAKFYEIEEKGQKNIVLVGMSNELQI